jgi:signal peptidase
MLLSVPLPIVKKLISSSGTIIIPSNGFSMYPVIRPQDECHFIQTIEQELQIGDIILFGDPDGLLVGHRIVRITGIQSKRIYTCKGDTNLYPDQPISYDQIVGKLLCIERKSKSAVSGKIDPSSRRMSLWGTLIIRFPLLSVLLRKWLRVSLGFLRI